MVFDHSVPDPVEWCSWPSGSSATSGQIVLCPAGGLLIGVVQICRYRLTTTLTDICGG
jgi:hypothetical protein